MPIVSNINNVVNNWSHSCPRPPPTPTSTDIPVNTNINTIVNNWWQISSVISDIVCHSISAHWRNTWPFPPFFFFLGGGGKNNFLIPATNTQTDRDTDTHTISDSKISTLTVLCECWPQHTTAWPHLHLSILTSCESPTQHNDDSEFHCSSA